MRHLEDLDPSADRRATTRRPRALARFAALGALAVVGLGCGGDSTSPLTADPSQVYWRLTLNQHAVTLSTAPSYDTVQLVATPRNVSGVPLPDAGEPRFTVTNNDTSVIVSPSGLITAHSPTPGAPLTVVVAVTLGGVTRKDSVFVVVNDVPTPPTLATLSIHSVPGGFVSGSCDPSVPPTALVPQILDAHGGSIPNAAVTFSSADPTVATVDALTGIVTAKCPKGVVNQSVMVYATATVYGTSKTDSVRFIATAPLQALVLIEPDLRSSPSAPIAELSSNEIILGVGGVVVWLNAFTAGPTDIVFDDPSGVAAMMDTMPFFFVTLPPSESGGNIAPFTGDATDVFAVKNFRVRRFPVAGTYTYRSPRQHLTGRIVVRAGTP